MLSITRVLYHRILSRISSAVPEGPQGWPQIYTGVALTTMATLILELSLTRIFSVVFYYHFAFLAISIALFGLGVGGVLSYVIAPKGTNVYRRLGFLAVLVSGVTVISLSIVLTRSELTNWTLALIYFTSALPFLIAGVIVSLVINETIERVDRVYFFDLVGAAVGCLLLVPFLNVVGGPNTVIIAAVAVRRVVSDLVQSGRIVARTHGRCRVGLLLFVALIIFNMKRPFIDVKYAKGQGSPTKHIVKWNSFSRIGLAPEKDSGMMQIVIDADASTGIANFDFKNLSERDEGSEDARAGLCVSDPARRQDARHRTGRRLGCSARACIRIQGHHRCRDQPDHRQHDHAEEVSRTSAAICICGPKFAMRRGGRPQSSSAAVPEKYQVLQATLVDTWASTAAGAFALSENNLYTTDAFHDYLSHLTDDGMLAFTRWGFDPPRESLRSDFAGTRGARTG